MATWTFSGYNNGRGGAVTFTYTASFNAAANQTTVTITNYTTAFNTGGVSGYCYLSGIFTVKSTDNPGSYGTLTVSEEHHKNGNSPTVSTDVSQTIVVSHGIGTSKQITISFSGEIGANSYKPQFTDSDTYKTETVASATARSLSISAGTGSSVTVVRQSSPWVATGSISNGATIYDGDVLKIDFSVSTGYDLSVRTVNGSTFTSGGTHTVSGNVNVVSRATVKSYTLTVNADSHALVTVTRGGEALSNGAEINHFDQISVTASAISGYKVSAADINGTAISPDTAVSHTVSGPVTVTVFTEALSNLFIDIGGRRKRVMVVIDSGGLRKKYRTIFK